MKPSMTTITLVTEDEWYVNGRRMKAVNGGKIAKAIAQLIREMQIEGFDKYAAN